MDKYDITHRDLFIIVKFIFSVVSIKKYVIK